jgi:DNA-directed RNA polymerase beta' subunit
MQTAEIRWSLLSPDEIRRLSVVEIKNTTIYDASTLPKENSINDHRMGTVDRRYPCGTCFHKVETDDGHPGHIELSAPVYHIGYIKSTLKILKSVCYLCSRICLLDDYFDGPLQAVEPQEDPVILQDHVIEHNIDDEDDEVLDIEPPEPEEEPEDIEEPEPEIDDAEAAAAEAAEAAEAEAEAEAAVENDPVEEDLDIEPEEELHEEVPEDPEEDEESVAKTKGRKKRKKEKVTSKKKGASKKIQILKFKKVFDGTAGKRYQKDRFRFVTDFVGKLKTACPHCQAPRPIYVIQNGIFIRQSWRLGTVFENDEERKFCLKMFTPFEAMSVLQNISDKDCSRLGLESRPENAILPVLLVPTIVIRPSIAFGDSNRTRGQDDLTNKLQDILKTSIELRKILEECNDKIQKDGFNDDFKKDPLKTYFLLQFHVSTYMDNNIPGQKQSLRRNKIPTKSIKTRLVGKSGRIRGNLQGKRVEFSARAVISPDNNIDMDQVGVPREIAQDLTVCEVVNSLNIHELTKRVQIGPVFPHGARCIIKTATPASSGNTNSKGTGGNELEQDLTIDLQFCQQRHLLRLQYGWKVERYMQDDDPIIVNRQPSLRKKSLLTHRAKIMDGRTIRLPLTVCANYNADFDGDEMNLHLCQNIQARSELQELMTVPAQLLNAQNNRPGMGLTFDPLLGGFLLTHKDQFFNRSEAMALVNTKKHDPVWHLPVPAILKPIPLWTGKQLFSMLLPDNLFLQIDRRPVKERSSVFFEDMRKNYKSQDEYVLIMSGELLSGQLAKRELGATAGGIIHVLAKNQSPLEACHFMDNAQRMTAYFLAQEGFGVGISDCLMPEADHDQVNAAIDLTYQQLTSLYEKAKGIGISPEKLEPLVSRMLGKVLDMTGAIAQRNLTDTNAFVAMKNSGSKGSAINISQIMACVGQNCVDGKRILLNSKRTLPCFDGTTDVFTSHGFVENSYALGLSAPEFFFHTMAGREGISDTAVKTARTGYLQRRLVKALEALCVKYDQTVRNSENYITSYIYGDDGLDASFLEPVSLWILKLSDADMFKKFDRETAKLLVPLRDRCRSVKMTPLTLELNLMVYLPIHFERLIHIWQKDHKDSPQVPSDSNILRPEYFLSEFQKLLTEFQSKHGLYPDALLFFETSLRSEITMKQIIQEWKWSQSLFDKFLGTIRHKFWSSLVQSGEMVGPLAAESIGEPSTQLSVDYNEQLLIQNPRETQVHTIGKWIDEIIDANKDQKTLQHLKDTDTWIVDITDQNVFIPSVNGDGIVSWEHVTGVTRHPPNGKLIKVTTYSGRTVTATLAKSFLTNVNGKVTPTYGKDLKVGMELPLTRKLPRPPHGRKKELKMDEVFSKKEIYFGSEIVKARAIYLAGESWIKAFDKEYQVPCAKDGLRLHLFKQFKGVLKDGFVYPKMFHRAQSCIPEIIPLNYSFGYFIGAYLADGSATDTFVSISKIDDDFRKPIEKLMTKWNIGFRTKTEFRENAPTTSLIINSTILASLLKRLCGHGSAHKYVPQFAYGAKKTFIKGLVSGYYSGDGHVRKDGSISVTSCSPLLITGITSLLNHFEIYAKINEIDKSGKECTFKNDETFTQKSIQYTAEIRAFDAYLFANSFTLTIATKNERAGQIVKKWDKKTCLERTNIHWDKIIELEQVDSTHNYVYDITVPTTLNFQLWNQLLTRDTLNTFHHAGIASKNVTLGVPRITELVDASRKIKTPSLSVYLLEEFQDQKKAEALKEQLLELYLQDVVLKKQVLYEPDSKVTCAESKQDQYLLDWFNIFSEVQKGPHDAEASDAYILRLELNRKILMRSKLSPFVVSKRIKDYFKLELGFEDVTIVYSHYNAPLTHPWVIRIRCLQLDVMKFLQEEKRGSGRRSLIQTLTPDASEDVEASVGSADLVSKKVKKGDLIQLACQNLLHKLLAKIRVSILPNIKQSSIRRVQVSFVDPSDKSIQTRSELMIDTVGSALLQVMTLPGVDWKRTISNDVHEVYETLGIEMAASVLFHEMKTVLSYDGTYINDRHIMQIVNTMTFRGYLMPLSRHGINRIDTGPLIRGSFEETPDILLDAAYFKEVDYINGVTDNITLGQRAPVGTGCVSLHLTKEYIALLQEKLLRTKETLKQTKANQAQPRLIRTRFDRQLNTVLGTKSDDAQKTLHRSPTIKPVFLPKPVKTIVPAASLTSGSTLTGLTKDTGHAKEKKQQLWNFDKSVPATTTTGSFSSIVSQGYPLEAAQDRLRRLQPSYVYRPSSPDLTTFEPSFIPNNPIGLLNSGSIGTETTTANDVFDIGKLLTEIAPYITTSASGAAATTPPEGKDSELTVLQQLSAGTTTKEKQLYHETSGRVNMSCIKWLCSGTKD